MFIMRFELLKVYLIRSLFFIGLMIRYLEPACRETFIRGSGGMQVNQVSRAVEYVRITAVHRTPLMHSLPKWFSTTDTVRQQIM